VRRKKRVEKKLWFSDSKEMYEREDRWDMISLRYSFKVVSRVSY